jgi:hypothetical protein
VLLPVGAETEGADGGGGEGFRATVPEDQRHRLGGAAAPFEEPLDQVRHLLDVDPPDVEEMRALEPVLPREARRIGIGDRIDPRADDR